MPIGFSDGTVYEDELHLAGGLGQNVHTGRPQITIRPMPKDPEVIQPKELPQDDKPNTPVVDPQLLHPEANESDFEISAQKRALPSSDLSSAPEGTSQDASRIDSKPDTEGLREKIRQGARWIQEKTGIGKESFVEDFLWKLQNSSEIMKGYFEGKIDQQDPAFIGAVTQLMTTAGNVGLATAPLRTGSAGVFGGALGRGMTAYQAFIREAEKAGLNLENNWRFEPGYGYVQDWADPRTKYAFDKMMDWVKNNETLAKSMDAEGRDKQHIFESTGLFKGKDGKWRHEIPDNEAKLSDKAIADLHTENAFRRTLFDTDRDKRVLLKDVLEHPALFEAYPELGDYKVTTLPIKEVAKGTRGWFDSTSNEIALAPGLEAKEALSVILHEVQHGIQRIEGFARGGSPEEFLPKSLQNLIEEAGKFGEDFAKKSAAILKNDSNLLIRIVKQEKQLKDPRFSDIVNDQSHGWNTDWVEEAIRTRKAYVELVSAGLMDDARKAVRLGELIDFAKKEAQERYMSLYGEIEARNVQERLRINQEIEKTTNAKVKEILKLKLIHPESTEPKARLKPEIRY